MPDFGPRWQLLDSRPVGRGGQGHAYRVRDGQSGAPTEYVAKVLNGPEQAARRQRLENEIAISRTFDHPNVVRVIDSGHTVGSAYPFFVMPFYSLGSLQDYRGELGDTLAVMTFFARICEGVAYIHQKGIVHRDLKPGNILVGADKQPTVGDFGICFREDGERLTETLEVVTARWFGAPELRNGFLENPTPAADVYSLGKLLYWLFTGKVYDRDEQEYERPDRKLSSVLNPSVPAHSFADDLVSKTVRYDVSYRLRDALILPARQLRLSREYD